MKNIFRARLDENNKKAVKVIYLDFFFLFHNWLITSNSIIIPTLWGDGQILQFWSSASLALKSVWLCGMKRYKLIFSSDKGFLVHPGWPVDLWKLRTNQVRLTIFLQICDKKAFFRWCPCWRWFSDPLTHHYIQLHNIPLDFHFARIQIDHQGFPYQGHK